MKVRPILFSGDMVRALLDGRKTMTRRVVKPQPPEEFTRHCWFYMPTYGWTDQECPTDAWHKAKCPYGQPGDLIWARETTEEDCLGSASYAKYSADGAPALYGGCHQPWTYSRRVRPSIHMERWTSRLTLEITDIRVERLQDISEQDAKAEGATPFDMGSDPELSNAHRIDFGGTQSYRPGFCKLWQSLSGPDSWDANPWVWVISFKTHHCNVDQHCQEVG